jgi:hypothetical protein
LFDGGGFQICGQGLAAGHRGIGRRRTWEQIAAGVGDAGKAKV